MAKMLVPALTLPVRGATVQARAGSGASACTSGSILGTAVTDAAGNYAMQVNQGATLKVCVRAEALN